MVYKAKNIKVGKNINLDKEVVLLANGQRLTEKRAQKLAKEVTQSHAGRPSRRRLRRPGDGVTIVSSKSHRFSGYAPRLEAQ